MPQNPKDESLCPICHQPNHCALVHGSGSIDDCWCAHVRIPTPCLQQVPTDQINRVCICRSCAESSAVSFNPNSEVEE